MTIQIDSREKPKAIQSILCEFEDQKVKYFTSKLFVGDYMNLDNTRLVIDRKQNLQELCGNVCQGKRRFYDEIIRANQYGIKLILLCEHSNRIKSIQDVSSWNNPRLKDSPKAMTGRQLMEELYSIHIKYGVEVLFCEKAHTGKRIIELLYVK